MYHHASPKSGDSDLQAIVDQQASTIQLLHEAFAAERQVWSLEKERLYQRIASLEKLLKTNNGYRLVSRPRARSELTPRHNRLPSSDHLCYSPAKSPIISPNNGISFTSPQARAVAGASRLASIAEDENIKPFSLKREGAPDKIELSSIPRVAGGDAQDDGANEEKAILSSLDELSVTVIEPPTPGFAPGAMHSEQPPDPPTTSKALSPLPFANRQMAGHTPLKAPRRPTPPSLSPATSNMSNVSDGIDETPTRTNTHLNTLLSSKTEADEDIPLKGALSMPELPNAPGEHNFTIDALTAKLAHIESNPEENQPMVLNQSSPGVYVPERDDRADGPFFPKAQQSDLDSQAMSSTVMSPPPTGSQLSQTTSNEARADRDLEYGGIKLRKKPSCNFGAPLGQLGSFGGIRKPSNS